MYVLNSVVISIEILLVFVIDSVVVGVVVVVLVVLSVDLIFVRCVVVVVIVVGDVIKSDIRDFCCFWVSCLVVRS